MQKVTIFEIEGNEIPVIHSKQYIVKMAKKDDFAALAEAAKEMQHQYRMLGQAIDRYLTLYHTLLGEDRYA